MRPALWFCTLLVAPVVPMPALAASAPMIEGVVVHVNDGDTIDVRIGDRIERVRYIGMDAPEIPHYGVGGARAGEAASRLNQSLVGRRHVRLELDVERRDHYGRLLAYVWVGGTMVNLELVRFGYARVLTIPPNRRYARAFAAAEAAARAAGRGLWGAGDGATPRRMASVAHPRHHSPSILHPSPHPPRLPHPPRQSPGPPLLTGPPAHAHRVLQPAHQRAG